MEDIELKIKELNDYFIDKIVNEEYDITDTKEHTVCLDVNGRKFELWVSNTYRHVETWSNSFMKLDFTEEQKKILFQRFDKVRREFLDYADYQKFIELQSKFKDK